ncbi:hypothetical protein ABEI33_14030 [Pantoea agglomerans]|nr:hypothetical protein [Pantoea agglomerans]
MEKTALLRWFFLALTTLFPDAERKKGEQDGDHLVSPVAVFSGLD